MTRAMTVTFRGMRPNEAMEADIRKRVAKLEICCRRIMSCHVAVEVTQRRHAAGSRFRLRIDMAVPGEEIAATREGMRVDLRRVIRDAFSAVRRRLQEYAQTHRHVAARGRPRPALG